MAETPSMIIRMIQLRQKNIKKATTRAMPPTTPDMPRAGFIVMDQRTAESCWWAKDRAHRRRYEAVCETQFKQNSRVRLALHFVFNTRRILLSLLTNGVNDLVDHDFTELKLVVLLIVKILRDHSNALIFAGKARTAVDGMSVVFIILIVQGTNA
jgi:hypothetical protein